MDGKSIISVVGVQSLNKQCTVDGNQVLYLSVDSNAPGVGAI